MSGLPPLDTHSRECVRQYVWKRKRLLRLFADKYLKKRQILRRTLFPGKVGTHGLGLEALEEFPVVERSDGALQRRPQVVDICRFELKAGSNPRIYGGVVGVDDRLGQTSGAADDGQGAVSQCVKLGQAAWFEARRLDDEIRPRVDHVGQTFVITDMGTDHFRISFRQVTQAIFQLPVSFSVNDQPAFPRDDEGNNIEQEINALLPGEAAYHTKYRALCVGKAQSLKQRIFVQAPPCHSGRHEIRENEGIGRRIPDILIDAVDDAAHTFASRAEHAMHAHAGSGVRISRA